MKTPKEISDLCDADGKNRCLRCGDEMRLNIPRMGEAGGHVHISTGSVVCPTNEIAVPSSVWFHCDPVHQRIEYAEECAERLNATEERLNQLLIASFLMKKSISSEEQKLIERWFVKHYKKSLIDTFVIKIKQGFERISKTVSRTTPPS